MPLNSTRTVIQDARVDNIACSGYTANLRCLLIPSTHVFHTSALALSIHRFRETTSREAGGNT